MDHFHSKHCFCSLKEVVLQCFHKRFCTDSSITSTTPAKFLGPTDPQNMTDIEFENFGAKLTLFYYHLIVNSNIQILSKDFVHLSF